MNKVYLECMGRMGNQILCWANAVHVFEQLGITDRLIVLNYVDLACAVFPGNTRIETTLPNLSLPHVTRNDIAKQQGDCIWIWQDVFSKFPEPAVMNRIIRTIQFPFFPELGKKNPIGIHVRLGDYEVVDPANPPPQLPPFIRASNNYFLNAVDRCRSLDPARLFFLASDGTAEELAFLTKQPHVIRGVKDTPAFDLFYLSRCCLIIGSNSTFSSVAAAYGNVPLIVPGMPDEEQANIITHAM